MTKLEIIHNLAYENDIHIHDYHFSDTKKASCIHIDDYKAITIDKLNIDSNLEECSLLAEELGHYETGSLYILEANHNSCIARSNRIKQEAIAKKWAIINFIKPEDIKKAIAYGCYNDDEIAEYCQISVCFLRSAFEYYKLKGILFF